MAHFLAAIEGSRGEATRLGTPKSGIRAQAQGWNLGVKVYGNKKEGSDRDYFYVYATSGSNSSWNDRRLGKVQENEDGTMIFQLDDDIAEAFGAQYQTMNLNNGR